MPDDIKDWEPFLDTFQPREGRVVVTKPKVQEIKASRTIIIPDTARSVSKEFGLECTILKVHPDSDPALQVGMRAIIPEFAGIPIVLGVDVPFWIVGEGDIIAVVTEED